MVEMDCRQTHNYDATSSPTCKCLACMTKFIHAIQKTGKYSAKHLNLLYRLNNLRTLSEDPTKQVTALIVDEDLDVIVEGWNRFPCVHNLTKDRLRKENKLLYMVHAEEAAILDAASSQGVSVAGATLYCSWFPCLSCTRLIIGSRIKKVVVSTPDFHNTTYGEGFKIAELIMREAGVSIEYWDQL